MTKTARSTTTSRNRRDFLKRSAAAGAFTILPSHLVLGQKSSSGKLPPSERVNLAAVGIGNQGGGDLGTMFNSGLCNVVALCDVDLKGRHTEKSRSTHRDAPQFTDFRKMFDKMEKEIDAVLSVATPDHSHFAVAMLAMSLGKHVYVEKPLAHTFGQSARLMALAGKSGVATQMGNQGHSGGNYFQFKKWTEEGVIKDVTRITAHMNNRRRWHGWGTSVTNTKEPLPPGMDWETWVASSPMHPFSRKLHPQEWRSWFDYGSGAFGDWGPHILDTAHRFLKLGLPTTIEAVKLEGPNDFVFPQASTIARFAFPAREGMPPCDVTWYDGTKNRPEVEAELGDLEKDGKTRKQVTVGRPGKIIYGKNLVFQGGARGSTLRVIPRDKMEEVYEKLPKITGKNSNHYANFLLACKGQEEARSPFAVSGELTQVFNLGVLAQRFGGSLAFDPATSKITNNSKANAMLDPAPRRGWEEFYKL